MIGDIIKLLRIKQYYKNLVVYLPLVFSGNLLNFEYLILTCIGFLSLCMVSSSNYILNDIIDRKSDLLNKEKRARPVSSGRIPVWLAVLLMILLLLGSILISARLSRIFLVMVGSLFISGTLYSLFFRKEPFLDVLGISINFVIRAVSGAFILSVYLSPWLILCPFFLALFLAVGKRKSEMLFLGKKAKLHRPSLGYYSKEVTDNLMVVSTSLLIISYSLYCFLSIQKVSLILTLPVLIYAVFRYNFLIDSSSAIARHPEKIIFDTRSLLTILIWGSLVLIIIYFPPFSFFS